jgi:alpha-beta hydrolase superfamily lysophospholipase
MDEELFEADDGTRLFARWWRPEATPRGVVIVTHGFKSHSGLYEWPAQNLIRRGLAVYAYDLRGHGRSGGERYFVDSFGDYVADLDAFVARVRSREPRVPIFLFGHSAGGVISSLYALEHQAELAGLLCESCAYEVPAPDVALTLLKGLSYFAPHAHVMALDYADFSRDPVFVERMKRDPLIVHTRAASKTIAEMIRADERLKVDANQFTLPLLILHGTADRAMQPHGSKRFYDRAGSRDKTLKLYEGHYHDLLNDLGRERVMADILEWLLARVPVARNAFQDFAVR